MTRMKLLSNRAYIWKYNIQSMADAMLKKCKAYLTPHELKRADRFVRQEDAHRLMVAYGGLRLILAEYLSLPPDSLALKTNSHGKPFLKNSSICFNISHANDWVMWAFTLDNEVGIDIEYERLDIEVLALAKRFFAKEEYEALKKTTPEHLLSAFYRCWTRKEAFIKAVGRGLSYPLDAFIVPLKEKITGEEVFQKTANAQPWYLYALPTPLHYQGAIVLKNRVAKVHEYTLK
jgi:4'-phosphopantetheinyl transferase